MWFLRSAVTRFMPGERADDALAAAAALGQHGIGAVLTRLGEDLTDPAAADQVARHYADVLAQADARNLDCSLSIKLTQLGLLADEARCHTHVRALAEAAAGCGRFVWIDMEQHSHVDRTLETYRSLLARCRNVGVCLQAYLYRTAADLASLLKLGPAVRLVKGAYRESSAVAYTRKRDVDENYLTLARQMLSPAARAAGVRPVFATHDRRITGAIQRHAEVGAISRDAFEFHLLFGVRRPEQLRLARDGYRVRVLISYGEEWFPWYMRRLAERPANLLFVARAILSP